MPVAIVISRNDVIPALHFETSVVALVQRLQSHVEAPELASEQDARLWLLSLPQPSGWFETIAEAKAYAERLKESVPILSGETVRAARLALGFGPAEFAEQLGYGGSQNTRNKSIWQIETSQVDKKSGKLRVLNAEATRRLRGLLAEKAIAEAQD